MDRRRLRGSCGRGKGPVEPGEGSPFDQVALETVADFQGRLKFLLQADPPAAS